MRLRLRLLGGFEARVGDAEPVVFPRKKAQALLAYLALHPEQAHPRGKLAALLWGEARDAEARGSLRQALVAIRRALPRDRPLLIADPDVVRIDPNAVAVDVREFERLAKDTTAGSLAAAADLYRGDLLTGLDAQSAEFEQWLLAERERLRELALEVLARLLAHQRDSGALEPAMQTALRILSIDPLQEAVHRVLMQLYAAQGRRGAALRQYQACVEVVRRELGAEPEAETGAVYREILRTRQRVTTHPAVPAPRDVSALAASPLLDAPVIGRATELAALRNALHEAQSARGSVVAILGEAGIGKTTVLRALAAEATDRGARVLLGRSYESEQVLAFGPWIDGLRAGQVVADKELLGTLEPVWRSELARLLPEVAVSNLAPPGGDSLRLFEAVSQLVVHLAAIRPLVLLLEDIHWADEMSVRLLAFLGRRLRAWPVLVVVTVRNEALPDAPVLRRGIDELRREGHLMTLSIAPLSADETAALVRSLTRPTDDAQGLARLRERVWRLSEGNPFVVVEVLRALADRLGSAGSDMSLQLPESVRAVIASRLEQLSDRDRNLTAVAAVIGREFEFALLQRASGLGEAVAAEGVEQLVRRGILHIVGDGFDFTHDRVRETVYAELLQPRRLLLHRVVASAIEAGARDLASHAAALGRHYQQAQDWDKAAVYLQHAGTQALGRFAYREATTLFDAAQAALAHLPETPETLARTVDLRFDLRTALQLQGSLERVLTELQEAERIATRLGDRRRIARALVYLTNHAFFIGRFAEAADYGRRALRTSEEIADVGTEVVASNYLAQAHIMQGDYRVAIALTRRSIQLLTGDLVREFFGQGMLPAVNARLLLARCLAELGHVRESCASAAQGLELARTADHPPTVVPACGGFGWVHVRVGRFADAIEVLERGMTLRRELDIRIQPALSGLLGAAYTATGRLNDGIALVEAAVEETKRGGVAAFHAMVLNWLAESYLAAGRDGDALRVAEEACVVAQAQGARGEAARNCRLFGEIHSRSPHFDPEASESHFRSGLALADELGMRPLTAHCHVGLGELYSKIGKHHEARVELTAAVELYRAMAMTFWLPRAETALATLASS